MIGKTISHYRIIEKIGQGGMGVVYKAEDTTLHRAVALKFLPPYLAGATEEVARFMREARAAAALDHPNICTIYEIDENAEPPFISMAYVEGKNLDDLVASGSLAIDDAVRYATQVARGLEAAHEKGVVHRDIKSANIVVSDKGHAIVMDFGLAKLQGQTQLTRAGSTLGTVSYMAPEVARGEEADHRSDIWSLGVVLYRMVTGRYPFEGAHEAAVMYAIMNNPHPPLTTLRPDAPPELARIVDKALAKDPGERYASASEMMADLRSLRGWTDTPRPRASRTPIARPRRVPRAGVFAGLILAITVIGFVAWQLARKPASTPETASTADVRVSIAVLPLDNMSADASQEYIADGMTEALIAELAQIHALRVISRTSVMRFKNSTQSLPEVAAMLGVDHVIEGSVVHAGGRVRVTAQLIEAKSDEHLWAQSYERDMSDVLALESEVARAIAKEVKAELTPGESQRLASSGEVDPRAYDAYLRGRHHWNRRTPSDLELALPLLQQAVDIQPDWAPGYAALAQAHLVMADWGLLPHGEAYVRGQQLARKALDLDPDLGSAWACLAGIESEWRWDWGKADDYFRKAIELEPSNANSHQWYAEFLLTQGRFDEARAEIEQAQLIDPLAMIIGTTKVWMLATMADFDGAIGEGERVIALDPTFTLAHLALADALRWAGDDDRAAEQYARFYESQSAGAGQGVRAAYARGGIDAVTRAVIHGLRQGGAMEQLRPADLGFRFASMGQADSAMIWFEQAYELREHPIEQIAVSPSCEPIHDDSRFLALLERMKLDHVKAAYRREAATRTRRR